MPPKNLASNVSDLNNTLADRSYIAGTSEATAADLAAFLSLKGVPDKKTSPHALRWYKQIQALRENRASHYTWPAAPESAVVAAGAEPTKGKGKGKGDAKADVAKADAKGDAKGDAKAEAKPAKDKGKAKAAPADEEDPDQPLFSKLDIRVGKVLTARFHPEADRLFIEEIDVGEDQPRTIVSGLREHYTLEKFVGRKLLAVCNMKPSKLVKVESSGMVLCAKNPDTKVVELLDVPDECKVGDRVLPKGVPGTWAPIKPEKVKKNKVWESVAEQLRTDEKGVACFAGVPLTTKSGELFLAPRLPNQCIS